MSRSGRPAVLAADVEAARQLWALNTVVSMPAAFIVDLTQRETVSLVTAA